MPPPPVVTGLSPKEGLPGTRVTIRGEFLGTQPIDLIGVTICGCDCLLSAEWKSPNKIIARSGPGKGRGNIIVTTRSGGVGTSTVEFRGYYETIGPMKESAVWIEEAPLQNILWGRRSMSPNSYQQDDPLGLSVEGNDKKFPEVKLLDYFPDCSGDLTQENFSPGWFLLENHHATPFNDLKAGLAYLRRKVEGQKEGQLSFLKKNVGPVMDQVDTLILLKEKFENDVKEYGENPTKKLESSIQEAMTDAKMLFEDVLARREQADRTRSALALLMRFKFLFTLPTTIEHNIQKGDYDLVINDYARVKNLFGKTNIIVFKKVLEEIEKHIRKFEQMLKEQLRKMPISIEKQQRLIRCLVNLEAEDDPAWDSIISHSDYIVSRLNHCKEEHRQAEIELGQKKSAKKSKSKSMIPNYQNTVPKRILFIEEVTDIIGSLFPNLWKMGQSYFIGELYIKPLPDKHNDFKHIILTIIDTFCKAIREAVLSHMLDKKFQAVWPKQEEDIIAVWLPHCLRYIRSTYSILIKLDLPSTALEIIGSLIQDLRMHCMSSLFRQATDRLRNIHKKETWKIEYEGDHGSITDLPFKMERIVHEVAHLVRESVLISEQREHALLSSITAQAGFQTLVHNLLTACVDSLGDLPHSIEGEEDITSTVLLSIGSPPSPVFPGVPDYEQRLLITLSNCHFFMNIILPRIKEMFPKLGYPDPDMAVNAVTKSLDTLDKNIMESYMEQKCDMLVGTIEPSMYLGRFDWDTRFTPVDISPYAKECITDLIKVHAKLHSVYSGLVDRVLQQIIETVAEEIFRLMSCVKKFSLQGNQQARADILALEDTVKQYTTPTAKNFFTEALEVIPPLTSHEQKVIHEVLKIFRQRMYLQVSCLGSLYSNNGPDL